MLVVIYGAMHVDWVVGISQYIQVVHFWQNSWRNDRVIHVVSNDRTICASSCCWISFTRNLVCHHVRAITGVDENLIGHAIVMWYLVNLTIRYLINTYQSRIYIPKSNKFLKYIGILIVYRYLAPFRCASFVFALPAA